MPRARGIPRGLESSGAVKPVAIPIVKEPSGNIKVLQPAVMTRVKAAMKPGKIYLMEIKPKEKTDSDKMRRYFWSQVAQAISDETGHSSEAVHESLKIKFLGYTDEKTGLLIVPSVFGKESKMVVSEKWDYIEQCRRWAFDFLNVAIAPPENAVL